MAVNPDFIRLMNNPVKFRMFLFAKLPSAYFSGLRIRSMNESECTATIPYKWFSQNPFRSTYFACLSMAAEMSTGSLAMANVYKRKPQVSMLVVKTEGTYFKKATGVTYFSCVDGHELTVHIDRAIATGEAVTFTAKSTGTNSAGELVAEFLITWSFKRKSNT
jgi:hypothetical protein